MAFSTPWCCDGDEDSLIGYDVNLAATALQPSEYDALVLSRKEGCKFRSIPASVQSHRQIMQGTFTMS